VKIAAQLYNCRDYARNPQEIEATLRRVKALGFDVIQISGLGPCDPGLLIDWVQEIGLEVCLTHMPWHQLADTEELKKVIADHKRMNCPHIGLGMPPGNLFANTYEGWTAFIAQAREITARIKGEGLNFNYHNHELEFEKWQGVTAMDRLIEELPDMLFTLDTFWVQAGGANPLTYIKKLKGRMPVVHFKDFRIVNRARQFAEVGLGNLEWDEIIPLCESIGVEYAAIEQDNDWLVDPFDSLQISRKFLLEKGLK